ncbi:MAG: efflux RND transporter periplasmic adaptor subunit [Chlorobi bacterium]|nr:efflux RND transporter periplasmic adaptor subunit [Chlorobiota bacterium]
MMKFNKKISAILIIAVLVASCGNNKEKDPEAIRKQIRKYRDEVLTLNNKIEKLEARLAETDSIGETANAIKVTVEEARIRPFSEYFIASGEVEAKNETYISPEVAGQIITIYVTEGQKVKKGQLLVKLDTRVIEENIADVKSQLDYAKTLYEKQKRLWDKNIGSERQYLDSKNRYENLENKLKVLQAQYNMSFIKSPINGIIEDIYQKKGELGTPGVRIMHIVDLDKLKVTAMISEVYLPVIHPGDTVEITFPTYPGLVYRKPVTFIGNVVNKQSRTFKIQVDVENKKGELKPNMLVNIKINSYNSNTNIVVPSLVIREDLKGSYLYVAEKDNNKWIAKKKYVKVGRSYRTSSEVISGLNVGDKIIMDGYSNVSDGTLIDIEK